MNSVILLAGGMGKRMNSAVSKQFLKLEGSPILSYSLREFDRHSGIDEIVIVIRSEDRSLLESEVLSKVSLRKKLLIVDGGRERYDSVKLGLESIDPNSELVLIHDGVRPFVDADIIDRNIGCAREYGACVTAVKSKDTVKIVDGELGVESTPARSSVYIAQTPQSFRVGIIKEAFDKNDLTSELVTDDSMLVERMGQPVKVVEGSYKNIKITTPEDIAIGSQIAKER